jgi:hypothetical protein
MVKLVKLQGGTATTKADMFFKRAGDREAAYESKFSKAGGVASKTPTQVGAKPKEEKESGGILDFLGTIASYLLKGGLLGLLAMGVGKLLENQDVVDGIKSFVKQVILGIQTIIQKGSEILGDLFSDPDVKEGFIKTFVAIKDLFVKGINLLGDLASDPRFAEGVVQIFSAIWTAIKNAFVGLDTYLKNELNVPGGLLTVLAVGGALYLAITALGGALVGLAAAAGTAAAAWAASKLGMPGGAPTGAPTGTPSKTPGVPGTPGTTPGTPGTPPGKAPTPGGFNKTAEDLIRERATRMAAEDAAKKGAKKGAVAILERFFAGRVGQAVLLGGPIGLAWGAAYTAYEVMDALAPEEQQQVIDAVGSLASIQDDIDNGGDEKKLKAYAVFHQEKLKRLGIVPQKLETAKVQALPSAPNESSAEATRLAGAGKPTPATTSATSGTGTTTPTSVNIPGSSKEKSKTPTIEKFDYTKYKELVGIREGGGKYDADNKVGFLGKYQFGAQALETFGYLKPGTSADRNAVYSPSNWTGKNGIASADDFKKATDVQENLMNAYTDMNLKGLQKSGVLTGEDSGSSIAAKLYAAHHGGVGGASKFFKENKDTADFAFAGASVGKSASLMATAYETGKIGGAEYSGLGGSSGTTVASQTPAMASSLGSMGSSLAGLASSVGTSAVTSIAANAPNMGNAIDSASTGLSEVMRMFDNAMASVTNITNNSTQASASPQSQGKLPSVYDDTFANLFQRVA